MYVAVVIALMFLFPLVSIVTQIVLTDHGALTAAAALGVTAKWYVFWAVGVRLSLAGIRQIFQPSYTAQTILGLTSSDSVILVRELGFANAAIGAAGLGSLFAPSWVPPLAMVGAIFYGLAGINHCFHKNRNRLQNLALVSDLFAGLILGVCFLI
jgi:predicted DNA repair protein MutK